jgi:hypothetical protein
VIHGEGLYVYTYIQTTHSSEGVAEVSQIFPETLTFYQNYLAIKSTADMTGGESIAV